MSLDELDAVIRKVLEKLQPTKEECHEEGN